MSTNNQSEETWNDYMNQYPPNAIVRFKSPEFGCGLGKIVGLFPSSRGYRNLSFLIEYNPISMQWINEATHLKNYPVVQVDLYNDPVGFNTNPMVTVILCNENQ